MMDNIQDKINKQADDSQKKTLWGKPANDILNGRDRSASAKPIRAIWEMVQNARDESLDKSNIVFIRKHGEFVFKHDGMPFTNDTLSALILQTSAKSRNDGDQAGQYGTGFLTTHKFGRKILLAGSLKLVDDEELYYNFPELIVDRSPNTQEKMEELYELLKQNMLHDFIMRGIDVSHFLKEEHDRLSFFRKLFKYRKELYALDMIWSGVLECSRPIGIVIETTDFLFHKHIRPACDVIDRMLILLMGDDFDKIFTEEELIPFGYPDVTDDELYQMSLKEEW